jgi:hypothetical protein
MKWANSVGALEVLGLRVLTKPTRTIISVGTMFYRQNALAQIW